MKPVCLSLMMLLLGSSLFAQSDTRHLDGPWVLRLGLGDVNVFTRDAPGYGQLNGSISKQFGKRWQIGLETISYLGGKEVQQNTVSWRTNPHWIGLNTRFYLRPIKQDSYRWHPFVGINTGGMVWSGVFSFDPVSSYMEVFSTSWQWGVSPQAGVSWFLKPRWNLELMGLYLPPVSRQGERVQAVFTYGWNAAVNVSYYLW